MTEHKENSKYIWDQFLSTKKKKNVILRGRKTRNPSLFWCSFVTQIRALVEAERQTREGGATCRGSTHSTRVSTLVIFHYIFKSRVRWVGETERERQRGEQEMSGGRQKEGCWVGERAGERWCPAVLSALDHLYITMHWCVQLCERVRACVCVFVHEHDILDKASVRCHISETPLFMYPTNMCHKVWERAQGFGDEWSGVTVPFGSFACNLISCMCHKSLHFLHMQYSKLEYTGFVEFLNGANTMQIVVLKIQAACSAGKKCCCCWIFQVDFFFFKERIITISFPSFLAAGRNIWDLAL